MHFLIEDLKSLSCFKKKNEKKKLKQLQKGVTMIFKSFFLIRGNGFVVKEPTYMQLFDFVKSFLVILFDKAACTYLALQITLAGHGVKRTKINTFPYCHLRDWNKGAIITAAATTTF